jgi:hypothetical protein
MEKELQAGRYSLVRIDLPSLAFALHCKGQRTLLSYRRKLQCNAASPEDIMTARSTTSGFSSLRRRGATGAAVGLGRAGMSALAC